MLPKNFICSGNELFCMACLCLQHCKYFQVFLYHLNVRKQEKVLQEKNPIHVNDLVKTVDIRVVFNFKRKHLVSKKNLDSSIHHHSIEGSKLFTKFTQVLLGRSPMWLLKHWQQILTFALCVTNPFREIVWLFPSSFCDSCSSWNMLSPGDRQLSAAIYRKGLLSSKCLSLYKYQAVLHHTFQGRLLVRSSFACYCHSYFHKLL